MLQNALDMLQSMVGTMLQRCFVHHQGAWQHILYFEAAHYALQQQTLCFAACLHHALQHTHTLCFAAHTHSVLCSLCFAAALHTVHCCTHIVLCSTSMMRFSISAMIVCPKLPALPPPPPPPSSVRPSARMKVGCILTQKTAQWQCIDT